MKDWEIPVPTVRLRPGRVRLIDQTVLPQQLRFLEIDSVAGLCDAIRRLAVRGAPALGITGAFGLLLALEERFGGVERPLFDMDHCWPDRLPPEASVEAIQEVLEEARRELAATRPTAVNLFHALDRLASLWRRPVRSPRELLEALHRGAIAIYREDLEMCRRMGRHGAELLPRDARVLTHCNTGGLATSGYGTALGVVYAAREAGKRVQVYADETRPLLQGARLTAWECVQAGIPVTVVTDSMAGMLMSRGMVDAVLVGADRIARNGDTANKIGTLTLAIAARRYGVPFYVVAPSSTVDLSIPDGSRIPIEERSPEEVTRFAGVTIAPEGAGAFNPAFDVTPAELVTAIVTEAGVLRPPFEEGLAALKGPP
jgi:methylthioribose-1-phosphate isomerase